MIKKGLTNNQLKILAMIFMALDHTGLLLFPHVAWFRAVGRLAFPIFAYMIAEGCAHTRNIVRYWGSLTALGVLCQLAYFFGKGSLYMCVLITFSMSVGILALFRRAKRDRSVLFYILSVLALAAAFFLCEILPGLLPGTDYRVDYGFVGVLIPIAVYLIPNKWGKLAAAGAGLAVLAAGVPWRGQWLALLALPILALYNGQRGKYRMKWLFYIFYPAHLLILYGLSVIL